jgi:uncharacterized membrane protein (UPF0127 family)
VRHFLGRLLAPGGLGCSLVHERTGAVLADVVEAAIDSPSRRRGLLGRDELREGHALVLAPCNAVHTCLMRFAIDVAFVTRDGRVLKTVEQLRAWRVAVLLRAFATIELPAGVLRRHGVVRGDRLVVGAARSVPSS